MSDRKRAGESRPSRRLVLNSAALFTIGLALLITIGRGDAGSDTDAMGIADSFTRSDAENAAQLLQSVNGANDVLCAAVDRAFNSGYWGGSASVIHDSELPTDAAETVRWIGKRHIDRDALPVARRGLASPDACTRRVAARIAGNVRVDRLDEELKEELGSSTHATRVAALIALGYAEEPAMLPRFVSLLQNDGDPEIRRIAAWALGQLDE